MIHRGLLFSILLAFLFFSCRKKEETPDPGKPLLMKINVTENYFHPQLGGVIFLSDNKGNTLTDTYCHGGEGTYTFYGATGSSAPSSISVTIARYEPFWHSFSIRIETYTRVSPGEWTLSGSRADTIGHADPVFVNIPSHNGPLLISTSGYSNLTFTPGLFPVSLYKSPDNLYIGIPVPGGFKYKWFENLVSGSSDTLDLSGGSDAVIHTLRLADQPVSYYECRVDGYREASFDSPVPYRIFDLPGNENPGGLLSLYYPPGIFQGYHTWVKIVEDWTSGTEFEFQTDGQLPASFIKIQAQVTKLNSSGYQAEIAATGALDALSGTWNFQSPYQGMVEWVVFGPDTTTQLKIPEPAPALLLAFPWLSRDSLTLIHAELTDLSKVQGYSAMVGLIFNPAMPSRFERQELSRVRVLP
jgi:hypothetical protein